MIMGERIREKAKEEGVGLSWLVKTVQRGGTKTMGKCKNIFNIIEASKESYQLSHPYPLCLSFS